MYSRKEFEETAIWRGYADRAVVIQYCKDNEKEIYTEEDLIECYRFNERKFKRYNFNLGKKLLRETDDELMQAKRDSWL